MKTLNGSIIRNKQIQEYTRDTFVATYKNHIIEISSDHGHGEAEEEDQICFDLEVRHIDGTFAVNAYGDFDNIDQAISYCIESAMLSPNQ